ncbi:phage tail protein [Granulicella arctica]|uniref:phage tail protein n=1 Tax=Granulicella arctica TaxID=940613 RepID=UPI0021DF52D0|nr:tail fiber protein [Granulicella arctica]
MSEPFIGEVRIFGFNFAPRNWAFCRGQLIAIAQNTALFSLLGTTYGGDGRTTFALPNLQGNIPVSSGQGPGLSPYSLGQQSGSTGVTLLTTSLPGHSHTLPAGAAATTPTPAANTFLGAGARGKTIYSTTTDGTTMNAAAVATAGGNQPHNNMMPYVAMNYCICLTGIFPSRN